MWTRSGTHGFLLGLLAAAALLKVATALEATITVVVPNGTALELPVRLPLPPAGGCDNCTNLVVSGGAGGAAPGGRWEQLQLLVGGGSPWPALLFMSLGSVSCSRPYTPLARCKQHPTSPAHAFLRSSKLCIPCCRATGSQKACRSGAIALDRPGPMSQPQSS